MIRKRRKALESVVECAVFIGTDNRAAARRFIDAVESTLIELEGMPRMGRPFQTEIEKLQPLRVFSVRGFPTFFIFYLETDDGIEFVDLLHGARDLPAALEPYL